MPSGYSWQATESAAGPKKVLESIVAPAPITRVYIRAGPFSLSIPCGGSLVARTDIDARGFRKQVSTVLKRENGVLGQLS